MLPKRVIMPQHPELVKPYVDIFRDEDYFRIVRPSDGLENYATPDGRILCQDWFISVYPFCEGFGRVLCEKHGHDEKWNFVTPTGEFLSNDSFESAEDFSNGFAKVERLYRQYNYLTPRGDFLLAEDSREISTFNGGFGIVHCEHPFFYNRSIQKLVLPDGNFVSIDELVDIDSFVKDACCTRVRRLKGYEYNYVTMQGKLVSKQWFEGASSFSEEKYYAIVTNKNRKRKALKKDGTFLTKEWYVTVREIYPGILLVRNEEERYNLILPSGKRIWKKFLTEDLFDPFHDKVGYMTSTDYQTVSYEELLEKDKLY